MRFHHHAVLLLAGAVAATAVSAAEPYGSYDNFSGGTAIDASRWRPLERTRLISGGKLLLTQREIGAQTSNSGLQFGNFATLGLRAPQAVTQMRAVVQVDDATVDHCDANPLAGNAGAQLIGTFFNIGPSVPGTRLNDVMAFVQVRRQSNSTDPTNVLRVTAFVLHCTNNECTSTNQLATHELGTVAAGTPTTLSVVWDQPSKRFRFKRDDAPYVNAPYTVDDSLPSPWPFKLLQTFTILPNCLAGPRAEGYVSATFDNFAVNASAAP
jgi:hypothetical protein